MDPVFTTYQVQQFRALEDTARHFVLSRTKIIQNLKNLFIIIFWKFNLPKSQKFQSCDLFM